MRRAGLVAALVLVAAGCELEEVVIAGAEDIVIAEVYLEAGAERQFALLHRTLGGGSAGAVEGATVRVVGPDGTLALTPAPLNACVSVADSVTPPAASCYASDPTAPLPVEPAVEYRLEIRLADGGEIFGTTTVPGAFEFTDAALADTCVWEPQTRLDVTWTGPEDAAAYLIGMELVGLPTPPGGSDSPVPDTLELTTEALAGDTSLVVPTELVVLAGFGPGGEFLRPLANGLPAGASGRLVVGAIDRAYFNWIVGAGFNPSGTVRVPNLQGDGTGVLGSYVPRSFAFRVAEDANGPSCARSS